MGNGGIVGWTVNSVNIFKKSNFKWSFLKKQAISYLCNDTIACVEMEFLWTPLWLLFNKSDDKPLWNNVSIFIYDKSDCLEKKPLKQMFVMTFVDIAPLFA